MPKKVSERPTSVSAVVVEIPKEGFIGLDKMKVLFGRSPNTIRLWVSKGWLPQPCNYNDYFKNKLGQTHPLFWDATEVWAAFDRLRGAA